MAVTSALVDNTTTTGSSGTTSTVAGLSFGSAFAGRVLVAPYLALGNGIPSAATIGGVSANILADVGVGIVYAVVPTGTSGDVVFTFPSSDQAVTNGVVALTGADSATASDTIANVAGGSGNIDVGASGALVAFAVSFSVSGSWTGATGLRTDTSLGVPLSTASFDNGGGALTNRAVSYSTGDFLFAVAFDASGGGGPVDITGTMAVTAPVPVVAITAVETPVWSLVSISEVAVDASGDYTLSEPAGAQQNDIITFGIAIRSNVLHTNADFAIPQSDASGNTTNNTTGSIVSYQCGYVFRGASPPSYVFAKTGGSRCLGTVRCYRSSRPGVPQFDTSAELAMGAASTSMTLSGGITTAEDDELVVVDVFDARANTVSAMDGVTEVTGNSGATDAAAGPVAINTWTERSDRNNGTNPTVGLACFDTVKKTAGSTGNLTATQSQSARHGMTVMAFKHPAAGGGGISAAAAQSASLGQSAAATVAVQSAASQALALAQSAAATVAVEAAASQSLALGQSATASVLASLEAAQSLVVGQSAEAALPVAGAASQQVSLGQSASATVAVDGAAVQSLTVGQSAAAAVEIVAAASQGLTIGQVATAGAGTVVAADQSLAIGQSTEATVAIAAEASQQVLLEQSVAATVEIAGSATQGLTIGQAATAGAGAGASADQLLSIGQAAEATVAVAAEASRSIALGQSAAVAVEIEGAASQGLTIGQTATAGAGAGASADQLLSIGQSATASVLDAASASQALALGQSATVTASVSGAAAQPLLLGQTAALAVQDNTISAEAAQSLVLTQSALAEAVVAAQAAQSLLIGQSGSIAVLVSGAAVQPVVIGQVAFLKGERYVASATARVTASGADAEVSKSGGGVRLAATGGDAEVSASSGFARVSAAGGRVRITGVR